MDNKTAHDQASGISTGAPSGDHVFRRQLQPLFLLTGMFFFNFLARVISAPLTPNIEQDLGLSHAESGAIFLYLTCGYFVTVMGSGWLNSRITHRNTIIVSGVTLGLALIGITFCQTRWQLSTAQLILGMAAGFYLPSGIAALTALVTPRHWGKAIAIHELAPNAALILAPLITQFVLNHASWRAVYLLLGAAALLFTLVFVRWGRGGRFTGERPNLSTIRQLFGLRSYWLMVILFSLGIGSSLGVFTMLPLYLVTERGTDQSWANMLISISRGFGLVMALVGGWAADRFGPRRTLVCVFLSVGALTVALGFTSGYWLWATIILQAFLSVAFFPAGFAALAAICPPGLRHLAVAFTAPLAVVIGGGVIPTAVGAIGDWHTFALGYQLLGGCIFCGALAVISLRFHTTETALQDG